MAGRKTKSGSKTAKSRNRTPTASAEQPDWVKEAPKLADMLVGIGAGHGVPLDYSPRSLKLVDELIGDRATEGTPPNIGAFLLMAGCYVGEVIIRNLGGKWHPNTPSDLLPPVSIELRNGGLCNPIGKAVKRFRNGEADSVAFFFSGLKDVLEHPPGR